LGWRFEIGDTIADFENPEGLKNDWYRWAYNEYVVYN
jgi:hypothetical protein